MSTMSPTFLFLCFSVLAVTFGDVVQGEGDEGASERQRMLKELELEEELKRNLIYPGTNWCGAGHQADELGDHALADGCCREHDQCPHYIYSFTRNYDLFNWSFYTMSHCECDDKFFNCLKAAGTPTSDTIGRVYFNILGTQCFKLYLQRGCVERNFWGRCKKYGNALHAVKRYPQDY